MRSEFVFAIFAQNLNTERNCPLFIARNRSLGQGNVFTRVCQSFCSQVFAVLSRGGGCHEGDGSVKGGVP